MNPEELRAIAGKEMDAYVEAQGFNSFEGYHDAVDLGWTEGQDADYYL